MARVRKAASNGKAAGKKKTATRVSSKPMDLEPVRQKVTNLVAARAIDLVTGVMEDVSNRGNVSGLKYLFEAVGMFPRPEGELADNDELDATEQLLKRLEMALLPDNEEDEDEEGTGETAELDAVE
jgi:hypothetical protein